MLRNKFWNGRQSQQLKHTTWHVCDSIKDYQTLLREERKVQQEECSVSRNATAAPKQKSVHQHAGQASSEADNTSFSFF